jgi:hypothetical protein
VSEGAEKPFNESTQREKLMNSKLTIIASALATALLVSNSHAFAQSPAQYVSPASNCTNQFFDPAMYNWFSIRNNCNEGIRVSLIAGIGNARIELDIPANQTRSSGESRGEYNAHGGYEYYACPAL